MELKKITKSDKNEIFKKINDSLDDHLSRAFSWIHTDEGQIIVNAIASLSSYAIGDPTGVLMPSIFQSADDFIRKRVLKRVPDLMESLNKISPQINEDFVKSDVGQNLLRETIKELVNEENEQKAEAHKNLLIHAFLSRDVSKIRIDTFKKILTSLEPIDFQILRVLHNPDEFVKQILTEIRLNAKEGAMGFALKTDIMHKLGIEQELFDRSIVKLESESLISLKGNTVNWSEGSYATEYFDAMMIRVIEDTRKIITPLGKDFVNFVTS